MELMPETEKMMSDIKDAGTDLKDAYVYNRVAGIIERLNSQLKAAKMTLAGTMPAE